MSSLRPSTAAREHSSSVPRRASRSVESEKFKALVSILDNLLVGQAMTDSNQKFALHSTCLNKRLHDGDDKGKQSGVSSVEAKTVVNK